MAVVFVGILQLGPRGSVELDTLSSDGLEWSQGESAGLNGISWSHELQVSSVREGKSR